MADNKNSALLGESVSDFSFDSRIVKEFNLAAVTRYFLYSWAGKKTLDKLQNK